MLCCSGRGRPLFSVLLVSRVKPNRTEWQVGRNHGKSPQNICESEGFRFSKGWTRFFYVRTCRILGQGQTWNITALQRGVKIINRKSPSLSVLFGTISRSSVNALLYTSSLNVFFPLFSRQCPFLYSLCLHRKELIYSLFCVSPIFYWNGIHPRDLEISSLSVWFFILFTFCPSNTKHTHTQASTLLPASVKVKTFCACPRNN